MNKIFFLVSFLLLGLIGYSQDRCGYVEYMNYLYSKNPNLKNQHDALNEKIKERINELKNSKTSQSTSVPEKVYQIPVVVHVIHHNPSGSIGGANISDAQVQAQIDVLNQDYGRTNADTNLTIAIYKSVAVDVKIQFCLASLSPDGEPTTGIERIYNDQEFFSYSDGPYLKSLSSWPNDEYLNLWVCDIAGNTLGYAQFPSNSSLSGLNIDEGEDYTDGVVIDYRYFGIGASGSYPYDKGRTTTHEVGHWLGLLHIWGDSFCGDDYVSDTPTQETNTSGAVCDFTETSNCFGPTTVNMNQNYMDYSADACMNLFSQGQKDRMRTVMQVSPNRLALNNSPGCCPVELKVTIPHSVSFEDDNYISDGWKVVNFDAASSFSKKWTQVSPGAYGESDNAFMINNDSVYTSTDTTYWDVFESPYIDLSPAAGPTLDFDLAYAHNKMTNQTDSLVVYYELGCKDKWKVLDVIYGSELISTSRRSNNFVPGVDEWKKITVDLGNLKGRRYVKFRIAVFSKGINKLYIDNINFYKVANDFELNLYPIPATDQLNVEVIYSGYKNVKIEAFNMLGKKLFEREKNNSSSFIEMVNVMDFGSGVYIFRVTSGSSKVVKRVVIN